MLKKVAEFLDNKSDVNLKEPILVNDDIDIENNQENDEIDGFEELLDKPTNLEYKVIN